MNEYPRRVTVASSSYYAPAVLKLEYLTTQGHAGRAATHRYSGSLTAQRPFRPINSGGRVTPLGPRAARAITQFTRLPPESVVCWL